MELRKELEKAKDDISSIIRENDAILADSEKKVRVLELLIADYFWIELHTN